MLRRALLALLLALTTAMAFAQSEKSALKSGPTQGKLQRKSKKKAEHTEKEAARKHQEQIRRRQQEEKISRGLQKAVKESRKERQEKNRDSHPNKGSRGEFIPPWWESTPVQPPRVHFEIRVLSESGMFLTPDYGLHDLPEGFNQPLPYLNPGRIIWPFEHYETQRYFRPNLNTGPSENNKKNNPLPPATLPSRK